MNPSPPLETFKDSLFLCFLKVNDRNRDLLDKATLKPSNVFLSRKI